MQLVQEIKNFHYAINNNQCKLHFTEMNFIPHQLWKAVVHHKQFYIRYRTNVGNYTISTKSFPFPYFYYPN